MARREHKKLAEKRIDKLFNEAEKAVLQGELELADRYVKLARRTGMKNNVTLKSWQRRRVCKRCYSYLYPGVTCRVRLKKGHLVTLCNNCKYINRFGYGDK